jgi:hypothetical protein
LPLSCHCPACEQQRVEWLSDLDLCRLLGLLALVASILTAVDACPCDRMRGPQSFRREPWISGKTRVAAVSPCGGANS